MPFLFLVGFGGRENTEFVNIASAHDQQFFVGHVPEWRDADLILGLDAPARGDQLGFYLEKIGAKVVSHGRYVTFQLAEVAVSRSLFQKILGLIDDLRRRPVSA